MLHGGQGMKYSRSNTDQDKVHLERLLWWDYKECVGGVCDRL